MKYFSFIILPYLKASRSGFWFDTVYNYLLSLLFAFGANLLSVFDEGIVNKFNYKIGNWFTSVSGVFRKTHTGEVNMNILAMALGIVAIFVMAFWRF